MAVEPVGRTRGAPPRAVLSRALSVPLIAGLVGALPLAVAAQPGEGVRDTAYWLQLTVACYAGVRLSAMILSGRRRLVQGAFWLFCYLAMGIAPLAQSVLGREPTPVLGPRGDVVLATALVLCGMAAFDVGALLARHRPSSRRGSRPAATVHRTRLYLLVALAYAGSALLIVRLGGPAIFFTSREEISTGLDEVTAAGDPSAGEAGNALLRGFGTVPAMLALLFLTRWLVTSPWARRRPSVVLPWLGLVVINVIVNNPVSNPRYWFLTVLFALLFTVFPRSPVMYRASLALGVVVALLVFPFTDRFRYGEDDGRQPVEADTLLEPLVVKDYDQVGMFANTLTYAADGNGHTYGRQVAGAALFFVPRAVWEGKPEDTGFLVGGWMGTDSANLSSPLWAELWLDFGPIGMTAGFLGVGYAAARTDRRYVRRTLDDPSPGNVLAVVVPVLAGYSFILLRGSLLQASGRIGIALFCLALVTTLRDGGRARLR